MIAMLLYVAAACVFCAVWGSCAYGMVTVGPPPASLMLPVVMVLLMAIMASGMLIHVARGL